MSFDLAIIGAGPAGCAAALRAAELGRRVLLLEQGRFPRHKVCGEFVSAESLDLLGKLLAPDFAHLIIRAPALARVRIFVDGAVLASKIDPPARSIARIDLDAALWRSCGLKGIEVREQTSVSGIQGTGPFDLAIHSTSLRAEAVINASGRWSRFTRPRDPAAGSSSRAIGLKAHFRSPPPSVDPSVDLYFFEGGYCGVQPVRLSTQASENSLNVCAMVRAEVGTRIEDVFRCHPELYRQSRSWERVTDAVTTSPLIFARSQPVAEGMLQAGDAARFVDPFVGDGISLALRSGALASACLDRFLRRECSLDEARTDYARRYRQNFRHVFWAARILRRLLGWPEQIRRPALQVLAKSPALASHLVKITR